jgi:hypothetical protein
VTTEGSERSARRVEQGDWQTPDNLAERVVRLLKDRRVAPGTVIEPTCGRGAFLKAAAHAFPDSSIHGYELSAAHLAAARSSVPGSAKFHHADFFNVDWTAVLRRVEAPVLIVGNPPWVTSATLGALASDNLPVKENFKGHSGFDAMTGKANFDISEWMILRLLEAAIGRDFVLAMLCKSSVARRVMEHAHGQGWAVDGATWRLDAKAHFDTAVDAVLLVVETKRETHPKSKTVHEWRWAVHDDLNSRAPSRFTGIVDGALYSDLDALRRTHSLAGRSEIEWRSGIKHDCAAVMELLQHEDGVLVNGLGEAIDIEPDYLYPFRKGSDVANGRAPNRFVLVTQRLLGDDTEQIRTAAPKTWAYLDAHRRQFDARKSSIYRGQPPFAMFGVGDYSFAPYKIAICGLYKRLSFQMIGPVAGRPALVDDISYFLPCSDLEQAEQLVRALNGARAGEFFQARVFWDAKRPINKALLQSISLDALIRAEGGVRLLRKNTAPTPRKKRKTDCAQLGLVDVG